MCQLTTLIRHFLINLKINEEVIINMVEKNIKTFILVLEIND